MKRHWILLLLGTALPRLALANVIFPAFAAPFFVQFFFPIILATVVLVEVLVCRYHWRELTAMTALLLVCLSNLVSWIVGVMVVSFVFPHGLETGATGRTGPGNLFEIFLWASLPVAFLLSALIEGYIFWRFRRKMELSRPFLVSFRANGVSYLFIAALFVWFVPGEF